MLRRQTLAVLRAFANPAATAQTALASCSAGAAQAIGPSASTAGVRSLAAAAAAAASKPLPPAARWRQLRRAASSAAAAESPAAEQLAVDLRKAAQPLLSLPVGGMAGVVGSVAGSGGAAVIVPLVSKACPSIPQR